MKRFKIQVTLLQVGLTILACLPLVGCIARPYGRSNTTTAAGEHPKERYPGRYRGSSSNSSNTTYGYGNSTYPRGNSTYPYAPRGNTTYPYAPRQFRGNTTYPVNAPTRPVTAPSPPGNTTLPYSAPPLRRVEPARRGNTTYPSTGRIDRKQRKTRVPEIVIRQPLYLARLDDDAPKADPRDWPVWRGAEYNGISRETGLIDDFDPAGGEGSNVLWKRDDLGGRSTPITMNGRLYALYRHKPSTPEEGEKVVCLNLETGETLWENTFNVWLSDVPKERVGWSSLAGDPETDYVYAQGVCGYFQCIDGKTGKTVWSVPMHERFGGLSTYGGRTNFPVICDDLVIISAVVIGWGEMAKPAQRFVAFNKLDGEVVWMNGTRLLPYDTAYSTPALTVLGGQKALVFGSSDGDVWALQPRTGRPIWNYKFSRRGLNVAPVVVGDTVFMGHSEENDEGTAMGAVASINGVSGTGNITKTGGENWCLEEIMMGKSSPVVIGDNIYCIDDRAKVYILDTKTGKPAVRRPYPLGRVMRGSPVYADGKIYTATAGDGAGARWYILEPGGARGLTVVSKGIFEGEDCSASPIVSHGKVLFQTSGTLYCLEDKTQEHGLDMPPAKAKEVAVTDDDKPAWVQVVPAELLTKPSAKHTFKARLFNARGQFLRDTEAKFDVKGRGAIDAKGNFVADMKPAHEAVYVTAKVGDLVGQSRIRVVPDLPWKFDFEGIGDPPITFVGARHRHVIRAVDGSNVMVKVTTIPKGKRSRCWFGHPELSDYTIQADVKGAIKDDKRPDIGLIAQGYTLDLQGENQELQVRSWVTELRMGKSVSFDWKPDTWYRMKLSVTADGGKATVRGKVWPRDAAEPKAWMIEAVDTSPNLSGSPGLFGNAKNAELYLDNITVTPN